MSIGAGVRLRVARRGFARCATEREESGGSREQHLPPVQGELAIRVFGGPLHRCFRCRRAEMRRRHARRATRYALKLYKEDKIGAPGRTRTSTMLPPPDFESGASTNSATGARH